MTRGLAVGKGWGETRVDLDIFYANNFHRRVIYVTAGVDARKNLDQFATLNLVHDKQV